MAELLFYQKPVVLDKHRHKHLRLARQQGEYRFASQTNSVVLNGSEMIEAAKEYPVFFVRHGQGIVPVALLGLRDAENLFVTSEGVWEAKYIPAFVRRYPFVLASGNLETQALTVCIDEAFPGFVTQGEGQRLFDDQGEPTDWFKKAIRFLEEFQAQVRRTEVFVNRLHGLDLLVELTARADLVNGAQYAMQGLLVVDEKKLLELSKPQALELFRCGELGWVYAHLFSLSNMGRLVDLLARRT
ncbi:MAG: SapC family protein [Magnetococcales bacterium]|nr:SapC family protein [Magnetococcales bacterium]